MNTAHEGRAVVFRGPCPFAFCTVTTTHAHPVCPACRAVRYGNMNCAHCRHERGLHEAMGDMAVLTTVGPEPA